MGYESHAIRIHEPPRDHAVSHDRKQRHENIINYVDDIELFLPHVDPANEEQHPRQAKQSDERCVEGDEEANGSAGVFAKCFEALLELGAARVKHVPHVIIEKLDFIVGPALERGIVGKDGVLRVGEDGPKARAATWLCSGVVCIGAGLLFRQVFRRLGKGARDLREV